MANRIVVKHTYAETKAFLERSSNEATARVKQWPWDSSEDEDDEFFYELTDDGWAEVLRISHEAHERKRVAAHQARYYVPRSRHR